MKPVKNRYFCLSAAKIKMLFESESQANNFIKFNSEEMEELGGKVPVRSYYCSLCSGWHVTSNPNAEYFETHKTKTELAVEMQLQKKKSKHPDQLQKGNVFHSEGMHFKAIDAYLVGFYQNISKAGEAVPAKKFLHLAFDETCRFLNSILDNPSSDDIEQKYAQAHSLLKRLKKATRRIPEDYDNYYQVIVPLIESFPKGFKCTANPETICSDSPETVNPDSPATATSPDSPLPNAEKKSVKEQKASRRKLEKELLLLDHLISIIYGNLTINQIWEAKAKYEKCTEIIQCLAEYPEFKDQLVECIDRLIQANKDIEVAEEKLRNA